MDRRKIMAAVCLALLAMAVLVCPLFIGGCTSAGQLAWAPVAPGADPVLVNAERADQAAFATIDQFMTYVNENREILPSEVITMEASIAAHAPTMFRELRAARAAYKATRDAVKAQEMEDRLSYVEMYAREARKLLAKYRTKK